VDGLVRTDNVPRLVWQAGALAGRLPAGAAAGASPGAELEGLLLHAFDIGTGV
jgi:hypothetical protein